MCDYSYRITVNGETSMPTSDYASITTRWTRIAQVAEDRDLLASIERRLVVTGDAEGFMAGLCNAHGYIRLGERVICPWEILAEMKPRNIFIIGGDL